MTRRLCTFVLCAQAVACGGGGGPAGGPADLGSFASNDLSLVMLPVDTCVAPCRSLATLRGNLEAWAIGATAMYVATVPDNPTSDDHHLYAVPLSGGAPTVLASVSGSESGIASLAVDASSLYAITGTGNVSSTGASPIRVALTSFPLTGGALTELAAYSTPGVMGTPALTGDGTSVFWLDRSLVQRVAHSGPTSVVAVLPTPTFGFAASAGGVFWIANPHPDKGGVGPTNPGALMRVAPSGGAPTSIGVVNGLDVTMGIAADAENVYWVDNSSVAAYALMKQPLAGGTATALAKGSIASFALAPDGQIYWTDRAMMIQQVATAGGVPTPVSGGASIQGPPIRVDATSLYGIAYLGGAFAIRSIPRP